MLPPLPASNGHDQWRAWLNKLDSPQWGQPEYWRGFGDGLEVAELILSTAHYELPVDLQTIALMLDALRSARDFVAQNTPARPFILPK